MAQQDGITSSIAIYISDIATICSFVNWDPDRTRRVLSSRTACPVYFSKNILKVGFFNLVSGMSALINVLHKSVSKVDLLFEDEEVMKFWLNLIFLTLFSLCFDVFICWVIKERCKQDTDCPQATQSNTCPSLLKVSLGNSKRYWATFAFFCWRNFGHIFYQCYTCTGTIKQI